MNIIQNNFCMILRDNLSGACKHDIEQMPLEEWNSIYEIACRNNLFPLLYYKLKEHKISIPLQIENSLRGNYLDYSGKDLKRKRQLLEIIKIFNDNGIDHILLKGSHLAEKVYSNSALRSMCDIDVLIRKSDIRKTYKLFKLSGYNSSNYYYYDSELASNKHYPPLIKSGFFPIELHWNINGQYNYNNIESIWSRAASITISGLKTKVLSTEDLLLHISIHKGCDDKFISSLVVLNDIKEICSHVRIDWERLLALASSKDEWDNTKCLFSALHLSNKLLGVTIPAYFIKKIQPSDFNKYHEDLLTNQFFIRINSDMLTYGVANALTKLSLKFNPLLLLGHLMTPRRICLRYNEQYSWKVLPYLYAKRIADKSGCFFKFLTGILKNDDTRKLYAVSKTSSKLEDWLKD